MKIKDFFENYNHSDQRLHRPYIVAEAGVNHECNMGIAKRLIDEAKDGGADAIKFQTYKAESLVSRYSPPYWSTTKGPTESQYELFKKYDKFWKGEFEELKSYCDKTDIEFMSTPFDIESAKLLNELVDAYKISSADVTNKPLIEHICSFNKPIILSTGASYMFEIEEAVSWIEKKGNKLALLHCVLNYPTDDCNANLGMILHLRRKFPNHIIGYSDHVIPTDLKTLEIAALLGAALIEKHFTYDKALKGNDHYHAMDVEDLKKFRKRIDGIFNLLGSFNKYSLDTEEICRANARRSLVAERHIPGGRVIQKDDLTVKRPGSGISPKFIDDVVGKTAVRDINKDEIIKWNYIEI